MFITPTGYGLIQQEKEIVGTGMGNWTPKITPVYLFLILPCTNGIYDYFTRFTRGCATFNGQEQLCMKCWDRKEIAPPSI